MPVSYFIKVPTAATREDPNGWLSRPNAESRATTGTSLRGTSQGRKYYGNQTVRFFLHQPTTYMPRTTKSPSKIHRDSTRYAVRSTTHRDCTMNTELVLPYLHSPGQWPAWLRAAKLYLKIHGFWHLFDPGVEGGQREKEPSFPRKDEADVDYNLAVDTFQTFRTVKPIFLFAVERSLSKLHLYRVVDADAMKPALVMKGVQDTISTNIRLDQAWETEFDDMVNDTKTDESNAVQFLTKCKIALRDGIQAGFETDAMCAAHCKSLALKLTGIGPSMKSAITRRPECTFKNINISGVDAFLTSLHETLPVEVDFNEYIASRARPDTNNTQSHKNGTSNKRATW